MSAKAGWAIWVSETSQINMGGRVNLENADEDTCVLEAIKHACKRTPQNENLKIYTTAKRLVQILTDHLPNMEDKGWIGIKNRKHFKMTTNELRKRKTTTKFEIISNEKLELSQCNKMIENQLRNVPQRNPQTITLNKKADLVRGAKLTKMTQALLYKEIMEIRQRSKEKSDQRATIINLDMTRYGAENLIGKQPLDTKIWASIRSKALPIRTRNFMYKTMHSAYKCGKWWARIPNMEHRQMCHVCDIDEDLPHILTECKASGQEEIWKIAEELWNLKKLPWPKPTFGTIMSCGMASFHPEEKKNQLTGANRLYAIIVGESIQLIWQLRCKWRITHDADPEKVITKKEARERWLHAINKRLKFDCLMTDKRKYGKKALRPTLVDKTWWQVLKNKEDLPEDWIREYGVLVGIGSDHDGHEG